MNRRALAWICLAAVVAIAAACAGQGASGKGYVKDGVTYGVVEGAFRGQWWNYYERGASYLSGDFTEDALNDLKEAVKLRDTDQWRARTYGMHFVDYFPHREMGITYFKLKRYDDALRELETSMKGAESARAKFYLNKVRAAMLTQKGAKDSRPVITINKPEADFITNKAKIQIEGVVQDDNYVSEVEVNDHPLPLELSAKDFTFTTEIELKPGSNTVEVEGKNLLGKETEVKLVVTQDREGPIINVEDVILKDRSLHITGFLLETSTVEKFTINDHPVPLTGKGEYTFSEDIVVDPSRENIRLVAVDKAGNITRANVPMILAAPEAYKNAIQLADASVSDNLYAFSIGGVFDKTPPQVQIKGLTESQEIFSDTLLIEGSATDDGKVKSVTASGLEIVSRPAKMVYFSQLVPLKEGANAISLVVTDTGGNTTNKTINVTSKVQKVRQIGSRLSIAVLPFEKKGAAGTVSPTDTIYDNLITAFVNQKRFSLIERQKINAVLNELKLSQTDLVDPASAAKAGKIAAADATLVGTVIEGNNNSVEVIARLVDNETSEIISSNDVYNENITLAGMVNFLAGLAYKFRSDMPLVEGMVIKTSGDKITVDLGEARKIKKGSELIVFREGEAIKHPVTGRLLGAETTELGEASVTDVFPDFASAVVTKKGDSSPMIKDMVITK